MVLIPSVGRRIAYELERTVSGNVGNGYHIEFDIRFNTVLTLRLDIPFEIHLVALVLAVLHLRFVSSVLDITGIPVLRRSEHLELSFFEQTLPCMHVRVILALSPVPNRQA